MSAPLAVHVDRFGATLGSFIGADGRNLATVSEITEVLNGPESWSVTVPIDAPGAVAVGEGSEIQVWEDDTGPTWGYVESISEDTATATVTFGCRGLLGLLGERYVGDTEREDRLNGTGSFDGPGLPAGWTAVGCTPSIRTDAKVLGAGSLRLQKTVADDGDAYYEFVVPGFVGGDIGVALFLAGYRRLNTYAPVLGRRGIYLEGRKAGVTQDVRTEQIRSEDVGPWELAKTIMWVPNGQTWDVYARLYAPGDIDWDEVVLVAMDSISTGLVGKDQRWVAEALVSHAQSIAHGKTDERIVFPSGGNPDTGVIRIVHYQHVEAANILAALQEFGTLVMSDGFDFWIETTASTRTFRIGFPRRGTYRSTLTMSTAVGGRLAGARRSSTLGRNSVRVQGPGDGPDRREAGAKDLSALGGKSFETVEQAPTETPLAGLAGKAAGILASRKRPRTYELEVRSGVGVYGVVRPGDSFPAVLAKGRLSYTGNLRAIRVVRRPRTRSCLITAVED